MRFGEEDKKKEMDVKGLREHVKVQIVGYARMTMSVILCNMSW